MGSRDKKVDRDEKSSKSINSTGVSEQEMNNFVEKRTTKIRETWKKKPSNQDWDIENSVDLDEF